VERGLAERTLAARVVGSARAAQVLVERALLERIAAYSGGKASFASDSGEFRTTALQMTRTMGIAVP